MEGDLPVASYDVPAARLDGDEHDSQPLPAVPADAPRIHSLPADAIARVSAGQVIPDPAAAAKELIENALDAGATIVRIDLGPGSLSPTSSSLSSSTPACGLNRLTVSDDGSGIAPADFPRVALAHCTSKLRAFSGLSSLSTLGFRGEALAAMCDVADGVYFETRARRFANASASSKDLNCSDADVPGALVRLGRDGSVISVEALAPGAPGTTFVIDALFSVFPARLERIRKQARAQISRIHSLVTAYALVNPHVAFHLSADGKTLFSRDYCTDVTSSVSHIFGASFLKTLSEFRLSDDEDDENGALRLHGLLPAQVGQDSLAPLAGSTAFRSSSDRFCFYFVNGRPVDLPDVSKRINRHLRTYFQKHGAVISTSRSYPFVFFHIQAPPKTVDVNFTADKRKCSFTNKDALMDHIEEILDVGYPIPDSPDCENDGDSDGGSEIVPIGPARAVEEIGSSSIGRVVDHVLSSDARATDCVPALGEASAIDDLFVPDSRGSFLGLQDDDCDGKLSRAQSVTAVSRTISATQPESLSSQLALQPRLDAWIASSSVAATGTASSRFRGEKRKKVDTSDSSERDSLTKCQVSIDLNRIRTSIVAVDATSEGKRHQEQELDGKIVGRALGHELRDLCLVQFGDKFALFAPYRAQEILAISRGSSEARPEVSFQLSFDDLLRSRCSEAAGAELEDLWLLFVHSSGNRTLEDEAHTLLNQFSLRLNLSQGRGSDAIVEVFLVEEFYMEGCELHACVIEDILEVFSAVQANLRLPASWCPKHQRAFWERQCALEGASAKEVIRNMTPARRAKALSSMFDKVGSSCARKQDGHPRKCTCIHGQVVCYDLNQQLPSDIR